MVKDGSMQSGTAGENSQKRTGYDKYTNWKLFPIPLGLLILLLVIPTPSGMLDIAVEKSMATKYVQQFFAQELFQKPIEELEQWELHMVILMEGSVQKYAFTHKGFLKGAERWATQNGVPATPEQLAHVLAYAERIRTEEFEQLLKKGYEVKTERLRYEELSESERRVADRGGFQVRVAVGTILFVVACFVTEAIPLPAVAFCIGIIAICTGIVTRENIAMLYWSDATWFIMGSLMFSVAFTKTGLDKRIILMIFGRLRSHNIKWITLAMIVTLSPLTMFMSDHALAAMFLPIGMLMYATATRASGTEDPELAKMLMITIAMACSLGGSLAPSGAARNIIMMSYAEDMFGINIGFGEWCLYCVPYLCLVVPVTWLAINWRFKPTIRDLGQSVSVVRKEIEDSGSKWTRQQVIALAIFILTLFCWVTEKNLILRLTGIRFGIGVFAVMGALAYIFAGVVNWRDYQTKVDWGVVWLYAGAIMFGHVLVETGGAYWIARSIISVTVRLGLAKGFGLLVSTNVITGLLTQIMADGPTCAAVGPITLSMAGLMHAGTSMLPFVAMGTSLASSLAYCLVIGTPPNAIVYASGYLEPKDYLRVGIILWFTNMGAILLLAAFYWRFLGWGTLPNF